MIKNIREYNESVKSHDFDLKKLRAALPDYFDDDGNFKFDRLQSTLQDNNVNLIKEGYELKFLGKSYAKYLTSTKTETVIVPDLKHNAKPVNQDSENLYIVGDNLDALKHLLGSYAGKVKCIYIDPPYNTGTDGFAYNDDFGFTPSQLVDKIGISEDEAQRVYDLQGKSSHSAWLTFMYPRLQLAKDLLSDDGAIIISIDENEFKNINILADDIFGEINYIGTFVWSGGRKNDSKYISTSHEYALVYANNFEYINSNNIHWKVKKKGLNSIYKRSREALKESNGDYLEAGNIMRSWYKSLPDSDPAKRHSHYNKLDQRGLYFADNISWPGGGGPRYEVIHPKTKKPVKIPSRGWIFSDPQRMQEMINDDRVSFGKNEDKVPTLKRYLHETEYESPYSVIYKDGRSASKRLTTLMGNKVFNFPKDEDILIDFLNLVLQDNSGCILDFFSGSGSTAHAVMKANAQDSGKRKYIMVQIPEEIDSSKPAYKAGYHTIDEIGRERIKRAAVKIKSETSADIDYGFRLFRLEEPSGQVLDDLEAFNPEQGEAVFSGDYVSKFNNLDQQGTPGRDTILATWFVQDGYGLTADTRQVELAGYSLDVCGDSAYIIEPGLTSKDVVLLVSMIENGSLNISRIVVFGYSIDFSVMHELKKNLSALKPEKSVTLIERF
jgi:site-specific DNA-methyltransferase (adenine-specific)